MGRTISVYLKTEDEKLLDGRIVEAVIKTHRPVYSESEFLIKHFRVAAAQPIETIVGEA